MDVERVNKTVKANLKEDLKLIFPEVFEDGKINFEKLKAMLAGELIEKEDDRFYFNWAQKSDVFKIIQTPAYGTLKPDKERSVDSDKTENIVIVGENLETLKLLLKPYFGKVKMIYIDPPYNTGKDFIYRDNFKEPLKDYLEKTGQIDSEGKKLTTNTEASGRYHSDWLNFIYPRLFLARSLLRDDGVIFISIDDHEVHHLRMIMDEIFGEENFVAIVTIQSPSYVETTDIIKMNEYMLVYKKSNTFSMFGCIKTSESRGTVGNPEQTMPIIEFPADLRVVNVEDGVYYTTRKLGGFEDIELISEKIIVEKGRLKEPIKLKARWRNPGDMKKFFENGCKPVLSKFKKKIIEVYFKTDRFMPYTVKESGEKFPSLMISDGIEGVNSKGSQEIISIFGKLVYEYPKHTNLLKYLISYTNNTDIILDFFAGSGTTGHAVWDLNKEDGGNRRFILVQLDEEVQDEEIKKEFPTVADICIERLRRVSQKYREEIASPQTAEARNDEDNEITSASVYGNREIEQDFGFKVFRLDKSNFNLKDEFEINDSQDVKELKKKYLEWLGVWINEPLVSEWEELDIVYEVLLKEGMSLNSQIEELRIKSNKFYHVLDKEQNLDFYISLDDKIESETIKELRTSQYKNKLFVFLDKALTDNDKINLTSSVSLKVI